ncbi:hypothetical protein A9Q84_07305 [Halobacteriovorax marinus]|uniref:Transposase IS200-like domain-containing protein n=1 Tax=Halobacteriovorax marinus TaxID=97084 RepID=A0A1Y5FBC4_9BACT|nr:hypothetical protein A9Q84_07305 [Halobacteriovorax marinus]
MMREELIHTREFPYHITARSNGKEFFSLPTRIVWEICCEHLALASELYNIKVFQFVLMSNHYHLLVRTPDLNIEQFIHYFQRSVAREINLRANRIDRVFEGPFRWSIVENKRHLSYVIRYIFQNPVRAGIVENFEDYAYSTIHFNFDESDPFPLHFNELYPFVGKDYRFLDLHRKFSRGQLAVIRSELRKRTFLMGKDRVPRSYVEISNNI